MKNTFRVLFYLKKTGRSTAPVMVRITMNRTYCSFSSKISISPDDWDMETNKMRGKSRAAQRINAQLENIKAKLISDYQTMLAQKHSPTPTILRDAYFGTIDKGNMLLFAFDAYIENYAKRIGIDRAANSLVRLKTARKHCEDFIRTKFSRGDLAFHEIRPDFLEDFHVYLLSKGYSQSTVRLYVYGVKSLVHTAFVNGWISNYPFETYRCAVIAPERHFLSETEIKRMMQLDLSHHPAMERVRDIFIFCCFTGLSHRDVYNLTNEMIQKDDHGAYWIRGRRFKTKIQYTIRLLPIALQIIAKYQTNNAPQTKVLPVTKIVSTNQRLKRIAQKCNFKFKLSTHMARHTFATTISLTNGISIEALAKMMGHSRISTTQIYAKVTDKLINHDMDILENRMNDIYS